MNVKLNLNVKINGSCEASHNKRGMEVKETYQFNDLSIDINADETMDITFKDYIKGVVDVVKSAISKNAKAQKEEEIVDVVDDKTPAPASKEQMKPKYKEHYKE